MKSLTNKVNQIPLVKSILPGWTDSSLREPRGGAQRKRPFGFGAVLTLDHDVERPVGIYKLNAFDRPRDFSILSLHVIHARKGMVSQQCATRHDAEHREEE